MSTLNASECARKATKSAERHRLSSKELAEIVGNPNLFVQDTVADQITGVPSASLRRYRHEGRGPKFVRTGFSCRYKVAWLLEWLNERIVETRDSAPREVA